MKAASVLIADDSLVIRALVRGELEDAGYDVHEAVDGASALAHCRNLAPDVVLLDIEMPGLNGYEVLADLKREPDLKDVPVVFLTSRTGLADVVAGLRGGAHDYLKKPFEVPELIARVASAVHVKQLQDQLRERNDLLDRMSRTDALTGLFNRRHVEEELTVRNSAARRHAHELSVLLLDLDHFKSVNDTYGHPAGDAVLREFASRIRGELRASDVVGRWGGEEFVVLFPDTDLGGAHEVADRIRLAVAAAPVVADGHAIPITVSGGLGRGPAPSVTSILAEADACLYEAKAAGRNTIVTPERKSVPAHT